MNRTGGVGLIVTRKLERTKGLTRVEFVCGGRALRCARQDFNVLSESAQLFSTGLENVPELITKQTQELREAGKGLQKLTEELAVLQAAQQWQQAPEKDGVRVVQCLFESTDGKKAKVFAHAVAKHPNAIALVGVKGTPTGLFFAQTPGGPASMADVLKQTLSKFGGKGGGARDFAQAGGLPEDQINSALEFAEGLVRSVPGHGREPRQSGANTWRRSVRRVIFPMHHADGRVAQLGERGVRNAEVEGSNPFASTKYPFHPHNRL